MKRLLAALAALCLLSGSASAKGLVIIANTTSNNANFANGIRPLENSVLSTLRGLGADFDVIRGDQLQGNPAFNAQVDSYLRHGKVWRNYMGAVTSTGDSMVTTYNPIIHLGFSTSDANYTSTGTSNSRYKADSLTLVRYYPTVTHLFIANANHTANVMNTVANRCSTGLVSSTAAVDYLTNPDRDSTMNCYEVGRPGRTWKSRVGFVVNATRTPKGWRPILGSVQTRHKSAGEVSNNYDMPCNACAYSTNPDTVGGLWIINNTDATGAAIGGNAKPMIFASLTHINNSSDIDMGALLTAIALADSMSSGGLLSASSALPRQVGVHIDDGWKRGDSNGGQVCGGIAWTDTAAFKASVDSIAVLGIPFVVGVEIDSLTDYKGYDDRWWSRAPLAHFTPHCHSGVGSPSLGFAPKAQNVATKFLNVIDQWGIVRLRCAFGSVDSAIAYGTTDYVNDPADSLASYWLTKRAFALLDSTFGNSRVDHFVMPPGDDWTNRQVRHSISSANALDSIVAAAALAGATGLRSNASSTFSAVVQSPVGFGGVTDSTNHYGYYINQQQLSLKASGSPAWVPAARYGTPCNVMSCPGYPTTSTPSDLSIAHASASSWSRHIRGTQGYYMFTLRGLFGGPYDESQWTGSATTGQNIKVSIHALHVGDLGSRQPATGGELTRPGFYNLKYLVHSVQLANAHALRPLVQFAYPDQMQP